MKDNNLKIVYMDVDKLKMPEWNPRKWSKKARKDLAESIKRYSVIDPIIVNMAPGREGYIVGGNFRYSVCKEELGYTTLPTVQVNIPDLRREKELCLRLNANTGDWDLDILKSFDLDLLLTVGMDSKMLAPIWPDLIGVTNDEFNVSEELKKINTPKSKPGDKYIFGNYDHVVLCGDSTNLKVVEWLMDGDKADLVDVDTPYNIGLSYDAGMGGKKSYGGHVDDSKSEEEYRSFITALVKNSIAVSKKDTHFFFWCDENRIWLVQTIYKELEIKLQRVCFWLKKSLNPTPNVAFNKAAEFAIYGTIGDPYLAPVNNLTEVMNREITTGNAIESELAELANLWYVKRLPTNSYSHPTEKNPDLHGKALRRCSKPGDIVLDLTAGSGSIAIAAHQMGRKTRLCEREPIFVDLIVARLERVTGLKARKETK